MTTPTDPSGASAGAHPSEVPLPFFQVFLDRTWAFVDRRIRTDKWALRPQPDFSFSPAYWTGGLVLAVFLLQVVSGLILILYYVPSTSPAAAGGVYIAGAPMAWASTYYIIHQVPLGSLILTTHLYGAYAVLFLAFVHFFRGYYTGVYKRPREFTWMIGTMLLVGMLGMGFTGYLLPYTALSVGATDVGLVLATSIPTMGPIIAPVILGNGTSQALLSRMFGLHVVVIPLMLAALLYAHLSLFEIHGIAPRASSDPDAKRELTEKDDHRMGPFFPNVFLYMTKWALLCGGALLAIAAFFPWALPTYYGSPQSGGVSPEPDWYFLWLYKLLDFCQTTGTTCQVISPLFGVALVTGILIFILLLPWIDRHPLTSQRTHPRDRPILLIVGNCLLSLFIVLTVWGGVLPGVEVPVAMYAAYLGALLAVNVAVVVPLYLRYRRSYARRMRAREGSGFEGVEPSEPAPAVPGGAVDG